MTKQRKTDLIFLLVALVLTVLLAMTMWGKDSPASAQATQCVSSASAGGTGDALTVPLLPCSATTTLLILKLTATNTITTPTLQMVGATAETIVTSAGAALSVGQLASGTTILLTNNGTNWILLAGA